MDIEKVCRSCSSGNLSTVLSLGEVPLANSLLKPDQLTQPEPTYPLNLVYCKDCSLVQITETIPPEKLFRNYLYFSSFSDTMLNHAQELVNYTISERQLNANSLVIELASNDGYLLQFYQEANVPVLGIEPAQNIAKIAMEKKGIPTLSEFFSCNLAQRLVEQGQRADVLHVHNVLAHVANLNDFVAGIRLLLKDDGIAIIEVSYIKDLIDNVEFDTIYHEHLCYFSMSALNQLFRRHGLLAVDVERIPIHGGSLHIVVRRENAEVNEQGNVDSLMNEEEAWGADRVSFYEDFGTKVERLSLDLKRMLGELKAQNKVIAAYGASAKGSTLLNYCKIGKETLNFVVDRSTVKQGLYTPGSHLPIFGPEYLTRQMPDILLLLTWNFADEILKQQAEYRQRGGQFLIPLPEPKLV